MDLIKEQVMIARQLTNRKVVVYKNHRCDKLITYWEDDQHLQRVLVGGGGDIEPLGSGPVDIREWTPLDPAERMRQESRQWCKIAQQSEGGKGIAIGCRGINHRWHSGILLEMARDIDTGMLLSDVLIKARETGKKWIIAHNKQRPKDINWARDLTTIDSFIDTAQRNFC